MSVQVPVYNLGGEIINHIEVSDRLLAVPFNESVVHQAIVRQRANARQEQLAPKLVVVFLAAPEKCFGKKALGLLGLVVGGHHCGEEGVSFLVLIRGTTGRQCLKKCADWL